MGNVCMEISDRVSSKSLDDLKKSYGTDKELLSYDEELYDPVLLQNSALFEPYEVIPKSSIKPVTDILEQEVSYGFSYTSAKQQNFKTSLINLISSKALGSPMYEIYKRRMQALCGIYESLLRQDRLKHKLNTQAALEKPPSSALPVPAQLGISFGISAILLMLKRTSMLDPGTLTELISETTSLLSAFAPMSCIATDPAIEKGLEKVSNFFESILKGELKNSTQENQLASISPLLGIALISGNVTSAFSIILKFLSDIQEKRFSNIFPSIMPLVQALNKVAASKKISFEWESGENIKFNETKSCATGSSNSFAIGETFSFGIRYYEIFVEKINGIISLGICDGEDTSIKYIYSSDGNILSIKDTSSASSFASNDKIGVLADFLSGTVSFYKNKTLAAGPIKVSISTARLYCFVETEGILKLIDPDVPEGLSSDLNISDKPDLIHPIFSIFQQQDFASINLSLLSPQLIGGFMLACIEKNNRKHRLALEKHGKSANIKIKELLSLDIREQTIDYLQQIIKSCISSKIDKDLNDIILTASLHLTRAHLLGSRNFPQAQISKDLKLRLYNLLQTIMNGTFNIDLKREAGRTITECFEIFFPDSSEQISYLTSLIKNYQQSFKSSLDENSMIKDMIQHVFNPSSLFDAFKLQENMEDTEKYFILLIEIALDQSIKSITQETDLKTVMKLLNSSLICLLAQFSNSKFDSKSQVLISSISLKLIESTNLIIKELKRTKENISVKVKDTLVYRVTTTFFTSLSLCKLDIPSITDVLTPALDLLTDLKNIPIALPEISDCKGFQSSVYESEHPYPNTSDTSYVVKVPYAQKYFLKFDPACNTEANCDTLKLYSDENKNNLLYTWSGTDFPKTELEVKSPCMCFEFHSDGSVNNWGWKIEIKAEVLSKTYKSFWPNDLTASINLFIAACCKKLIKFDFETVSTRDEIANIINSPICKYGIKDKTLGILNIPAKLPEKLINLASKQGRNRSDMAGLNKKLMVKEDTIDDLVSYSNTFGKWDQKYSDISIIQDLIIGTDDTISGWRELKQVSGVKGPGSNIGGTDLNQAERAVFAVYVSLFEITDTVGKIFLKTLEIGSSIKYIVKQVCNIRQWAQKRKQILIDSGKIIGYADIGKDIVEKCALILNSEYRKGLINSGVQTKLTEITGLIKSSSIKNSVSSKWKTVKEAVSIIQKLGNLLSLSKPKPQNQDMIEISKIWNIVLVIFEEKLNAQEILGILDRRRVRALSKAIGYRFFNKLVETMLTTETVEVFSQCVVTESGKQDVTVGLEATDPVLITCVQSSFYTVYKVLVRKLSEIVLETYFDLYLVLNLIESLNYPILESDLHYFFDLNISSLFRRLLEWSKGNFGNLKVSKVFSIETCVTSLKLYNTNETGSVLVPNTENLYIACNKGENKLPIVELIWSHELIPDYEDSVGPVTVENQVKYILIKRSNPSPLDKYLANINPGFEIDFQPFNYFNTQEDSEEKLKVLELKQKISEASFCLVKLLMTSLNNHSLQETIVFELFKELSEVKSSFSLSLDETCTGNTWLGKIESPTSLQKNPMEKFLKEFYREVPDSLPIKQIIESHVRTIDHGLKGVLDEEDEANLSEPAKKLLKKNPNFRNSGKKVDFFSYLNHLYAKRNELDEPSSKFIETSKAFQNLPVDYYKALDQSNLANIAYITMYAISKSNSTDFASFLNAFIQSETPGIATAGDFPEDFKNTEGNYDLYQSINKISSNPEKFSIYYQDVISLIQEFGVFPSSCLSMNKEQSLIEDYQGTVLWLIFSQCSQQGIIRAVSRKARLRNLLIKALSGSQELSALSMLILCRSVPTQHSFESFSQIWQDLPSSSLPKNGQKDFLKYLLFQLGSSAGFYLQTSNWNKVKRNSEDCLELIRHLATVPRWKERVLVYLKDSLFSLNKKIEESTMITEIEAGALVFLAMNGPSYSGIDSVIQPLTRVKLELASLSEGILWVLNDDTCKIFSVESDSFQTESKNKITRVIHNSDFFKDLQEPGLFDLLLKTWSLVQNFNVSNSKTPAKLYLGNKLILKRIESLALETLITLSDKKQGITRNPSITSIDWRTTLAIKENLALKMENKQKAEAAKQMTPEEIQTRISGLDEKSQILFTEVASLGYGSNLILAALDSGCTTPDEIIESIVGVDTPKPLFNLSKYDDEELEIIDLGENGLFYQSSKGHMIISTLFDSSDKKVYSKVLDETLFHNSKGFIDNITILVCICGAKASHKCEYGLKVGDLDIKFETVVDNTQIDISGKFTIKIVTQAMYNFKIFAGVSGEIEISGDNFMFKYNTIDTTVFTGTKVGNFSLYMKEGSKVELKGLTVYEGRIEKNIKFFEEDIQTKDNFEKFVKVRLIESGYTKNRLGLMGIPKKISESLAEKYYDLEKCIQEAVKLDSSAWPDPLSNINNLSIHHIKLFKSSSEVEPGYEEVRVFENGEISNTILRNRKVIGIKRTEETSSKKLSELYIGETAGAEIIDEMFLDSSQESLKIYGAYTDKLPCIKDIILIITKNPLRVGIPPGYKLLSNKEGMGINLAAKEEKSFCLFLGYTTFNYMLNYPIRSLTLLKQPVPSYGLENSSESKSAKEDTDIYKTLSIIELINSLLEAEEQRIQVCGKDFMMSISAHKPEALVSSVETKGIAYLLNMFNDDYSSLTPFLNTVINTNNKSVIEKILVESILQLIHACSNSDSGVKAKVYESPHSYNNSTDLDEEIYFPGATKLLFEFDSQCYTESGCDYLAFYKKTGRQEEIKKFSGQGESVWQSFEYPGDRLYMYFHSDSSVVYWGYKFTVKPVIKKKPTGRKFNINAILFILDYISQRGFAVFTSKFFKKEILVPIFLVIHTNDDLEIIQKCINILSKLIITLEPCNQNILEILVKQASALQKTISQGPNVILISLLSFLARVHQSKLYYVKEKWFLNFYNCYYDMRDLSESSASLASFLFEYFKEKLLKSAEKFYESTHPYNKEPKTEFISFPGASAIEITFDPSSALDEGDEIYFSTDIQGKLAVESGADYSKSLTWSDTNKGPDIVISNQGLTVTRSSSSGWGIVQSSQIITKTSVSITISIDDTDDSVYWYIGLLDPTDTINLSTNMSNDSGFRLWTWKKNGDFAKKGEINSKGTNFGFAKGDTLQLNINCPETTVTFLKNGETMHSFNDISEKVVLAMSFGGSNQIGTIVSIVEEGGSLSSIKKRKIKIPSNSVYVHFPINQGIYNAHTWESINDASINTTPYHINRIAGDGPSVHFTSTSLSSGRHYIEFEFVSLSEKSQAIVFISRESISRTQSVVGNCAGYKNQGNVIVGPNSTACKGYKKGDAIGAYIDFSKPEVRFYKNKLLAAACKIEIPIKEYYRFGVMLTCSGQEIKIKKNVVLPDDVDLLGILQPINYGLAGAWGYKFKAVPVFSDRSAETVDQVLKYVPEEDKKLWKEYQNLYTGIIRSGAAEELIIFIDELVVNIGKVSTDLQNSDINPQPPSLIYYKNLEKISIKEIQELARIFQGFNLRVKENLGLFDLNITENPSDFQKAFLSSRKYIFFDIKKSLFTAQLDKSKNDSRPDIIIDRTKAMIYKSQGKIDKQAQFSIYGQLLRCMNQRNNTDFRNSERIFKVSYRGEGAIDAGGPYNEVMSNICDELQSNYLPLLTPTQNNINNVGEHRDAWTVNPEKLKLGQEMFLFLGKIMGAAIRTQNNLNLSLPPLAWKKIVVDAVDLLDLKGIDEVCYQMIEILKNLDAKSITKENFFTAFSDEYFTTRLSNGELVDLVKAGSEIAVVYENALEYATLVTSARLEEADNWYKTIRKGISAVIPIDLLNLFSWKQVETLVCGSGDIKIEVLKANTEYTNGTNESDPHISYFWDVLTEMNSKEKQLFLRFVWGRSRLPASKTFTHMKISKLVPRGPVDNYLPVTHTCFFTIDLPPYNTKEVMKNKLLYAITHCTAIDLDTTPTSGGWEENEIS